MKKGKYIAIFLLVTMLITNFQSVFANNTIEPFTKQQVETSVPKQVENSVETPAEKPADKSVETQNKNAAGEPADWPTLEEEKIYGRYKPRYIKEDAANTDDRMMASPYAVSENLYFKWWPDTATYGCTHTFYRDPQFPSPLTGQSTSLLKLHKYGKVFCTEGGYGIWTNDGRAPIPSNNKAEWDSSSGWNLANWSVTNYGNVEINTIPNKVYKIACEYYGKAAVDNNRYQSTFTQMAIWNMLPLSEKHTEGMLNGRYLTYFTANSTISAEYTNFLNKIVIPQLNLWNKKPGFTGGTINMKPGETRTLTDTIGTLRYYGNFSYTQGGVTITHKYGENTMTATVSANPSEIVNMTEAALIKAGACKYGGNPGGSYITFISPQRQNMVQCSGRVTPIGMSINFKIDLKGKLKAKKVIGSDKHLVEICPNQYSLAGAEYGVYEWHEYAVNDTHRIKTLTTDANGNMPVIELGKGSNNGVYYIKEVKPPKGFKLNSQVYQVQITPNQTTDVTVSDDPYTDPMTILVKKSIPKGLSEFTKYLEGAEYTIKYYPDILNTESEVKAKTPMRTWVFRTDANGEIKIRDKWKVGGDPLFKNDKGMPVGLIGTYTIEETKAPSGFIKNNGIAIRHVKKDIPMEDIDATNTPIMSELPDNNINRKIEVTKKIAEPDFYEPYGIPSAIFELTGKDVFGNTIKLRRAIILDKSTLKNGYYTGKVTFDNLPAGEYTVREVKKLRYKLKGIDEVTANGTIRGENVDFELVNSVYGHATYQNTIPKWDKTTHETCVVNHF